MRKPKIRYTCDNCGKKMTDQELRYIVKIDVYAAPTDIVITEEDLQRDLQSEIRKLCKKMKYMDAKKLTDEVYRNYELDLCKECRDKFTRRIELKEFS